MTTVEPFPIGSLRFIPKARPLLIAGPCVIETEELSMKIAEEIAAIGRRLKIPVVFKGSFDKANRTSANAFRGIGIEEGLKILEKVRRETDLPVTTDVHLPEQAEVVASVCDLLQIPAFLARQTDLLIAAAATDKPLNVKKGQFMSPHDMRYVVEKLRAASPQVGSSKVMLCERGTFFGYGRLVNDMTSIPIMQSLRVPVLFDATHSVQQPGGLGGATGGNRLMVEPLARAAAGIGADGFFFETHPDPDRSPSDGPNMVPLNDFGKVVERIVRIWETVQAFSA